MRRKTLTTLALVAAIAAILIGALLLDSRRSGDDERFVGSDTAATTRIEAEHPDYQPWFESVFTPSSGEIESGLFAMQAAIGAGVFGYAIGALRNRRQLETVASPAGQPVSIAWEQDG